MVDRASWCNAAAIETSNSQKVKNQEGKIEITRIGICLLADFKPASVHQNEGALSHLA